jgi:hypothetical protein
LQIAYIFLRGLCIKIHNKLTLNDFLRACLGIDKG